MIEHAFGALKNRSRILKSFSGSVEKCANVTVAYCVLHNYCELHGDRVPPPEHHGHADDPFASVHRGNQRVPNHGDVGKVAGENMGRALNASWLARNTYV